MRKYKTISNLKKITTDKLEIKGKFANVIKLAYAQL